MEVSHYGVIGLEETIRTFVDLNKRSLLEPGKKDKTHSFTDTLEFTTTLKANADPRIVLSPVRGDFRLTEAKGSFVADRTDKHKVVIALEVPVPSASVAGGPREAIAPPAGESSKSRALFSLERQRDLSNSRKLLDILRTAP